MRDKFATFIIVTLITLTIWLYAEAESLGRESTPARVEFVSARNDLMIRPTEGFDGRVTVELSGSKAALSRALLILEGPIRLEPGKGGIPDTGGETRVNLQAALQQHERLLASGVTIEAVRPPMAPVELRELIQTAAPIITRLPNVEIAGEVTIDPPQAMVRIPRSVAAGVDAAIEVIAAPTPDQLARLPESGPVTLPVNLALSDALRAERGAELLTARATLTFSIRSTLVPATLPVPVQVLLPSIEQSLWTVAIDPEDAILNVEVSGPSETITRLKSPAEGLIAVLSLSSDELARGISSKAVGFAVLRQGVPAPLPESVAIRTPSSTVRFQATKRSAE